ncbi:MAG: bifunctional oligoribonuclease/PAP phosphatase NrnA [Muribaculaceae bacterium]|nr:bifunctional oligoribonuclease/PAP phosphatase NrnA [Roseburia sp.]MCM1431003.1 bifunctional oligoribonuclease/PAP phosphatase NrnA [Muribaculaceae bacterium]MCM1493763.1 bifunctional oligoribonuclease/PAP phosphatase NrnA [Muribaculaceae bacterium]
MERIDELLQGVQTVAIAGHVRPDGDCVGSTLALYNYIREYYPALKARLYLEPIPNIFKFLKRSEEIVSDFSDVPVYDVFFCLDCGDAGRLGAAAKYFDSAKRTVCIDHHMSNQAFAMDNYILPDASSTCELVFTLMEEEKITREIAECLYTGMVHDTGVFQYSCTSKKTMEIAGTLMEKGIDYPKIVDETFYTKTFCQNRILGQALVDSRLYLQGRCIVSIVTQKMMREYGVYPKHLDGIVNQLRVTKGVEVAVFLYENVDGTYKGSLRVNGDCNVAEVAMVFGGGGHVKAAGFTIAGEPEECVSRILAEIEKRL